jgi:hypothetical protein
MNLALADIRQWLEDMTTLRKLSNVHIFNPLPALGMTGPEMDIDHALELWRSDPVHPTEEGYAALAESVKQFCHNIVAGARALASEAASKAVSTKPRPPPRPKPVRREGWIAGSDEVAKRNTYQHSYQGRSRSFPPTGDVLGSTSDPGVTAAGAAHPSEELPLAAALVPAPDPDPESAALAAAAGGGIQGGNKPPPPPLPYRSLSILIPYEQLLYLLCTGDPYYVPYTLLLIS